jgi:hypothetical protein
MEEAEEPIRHATKTPIHCHDVPRGCVVKSVPDDQAVRVKDQLAPSAHKHALAYELEEVRAALAGFPKERKPAPRF